MERCAEAAQHLDDPVALAVAAVNRGRIQASTGAYGPARSTVDRAAVELDRHTEAPAALDVLGFLHLARAHHLTGLRDHAAAAEHLAEAERVATRTGETDAWDLAWGPRDVALWRIAMLLDAGRPDEAVRAAAGVDTRGLPPVRAAYFYVGLARGLADLGRGDEAVRMLLHAERVGPQHTRSSAAARETARALLESARRAAGGTQLRGLCERMGLAL